MSDLVIGSSPAWRRVVSPRRVARLGRLLVGLALAALATGSAGAAPSRGLTAAPLAAPPVFAGPSRGVPGTQTPTGADFVRHCNSYVIDGIRHVGSTAILTGTATENSGCAQAVLYLNRPGSGRLHATVGVSADETKSTPMKIRVRVVDDQGYVLRGLDLTVSLASGPRSIDVGVASAAAVAFDFPEGPNTILYNVTLSGAAQVLRPAAQTGAGLPTGASPVNLAGVPHSCNAYIPTTMISVTLVGLPPDKAVTASGCGDYTLSDPPGSRGTLVLRYGAVDDSNGAKRGTLTVRVLNADGHVVRKAVGVAFAGGGLRPLWIDLRGGATVNLKVDGNVNVAITGAGILPGKVTPTYQNPQRTLFGGAPGGVGVDALSFISRCNAYDENSDITVGGQVALGGSYVSLSGCGSTRIVLGGNASGTFHAILGVPDDAQGGAQPQVKIIATAADNSALLVTSKRAPYATPGTAIDVPLSVGTKHVSVITFNFTGGTTGVLYAMRLTGNATAYSVVTAPVNPTVVGAGGTAISPYAFALDCNAYANKEGDSLLLHEAALQDWAISFTGCGGANLPLAALPYAHQSFQARVGVEAGQPATTLVVMHFDVINTAGKKVRGMSVKVRYGYGPLNTPVLDLRGGAKLHIWGEGNSYEVILYAMTAR